MTTLRSALLLVSALALTTACPAPNRTGDDPAPRVARGDAASPPTDGYFRWRLRENPPDLDPAQATDTMSGAVVLRVNDGLVAFEPMTLAVVPAVAKSWTVSDDGLVYEFELRDDVYFHTGRKVTAEDVDYSFHRTLQPALNSERRWVLINLRGARDYSDGKAGRVAGIEVLSPLSIRLTLEEPFAPFLGLLCMEAASIIPKEVYDDPERGYLRHPVGCGPFAFEEWQQSNFLKLKTFDRYYGGRAKINGITFRFIENMVTAVEEYRNGGLDGVDEIPPGTRRRLEADLPGEYQVWPQTGVFYFDFNHSRPPFQGNLKLRQALSLAVDRRYICDKLQEGKDTPANGILPPGIPGHDPQTTVDPYDPEKAKQLLAEAGFPGGQGLEPIVFWTNTNEGHQRVAQQVQSDLAQIGVRMELRNMDWGTYLEMIEGTATEPTQASFYRMGWIADYPDPDNFMTVRLSKDYFGPKGNYSRFTDPEFERLITEARRITRLEDRVALYHQAERIAMEQACWLAIYYYGEEMLLKPYVKGFQLSPQGDFTVPLEDIWFEQPAAPK